MPELLPDWPAAMRRELAAQYLDISVAAFTREVFVGAVPKPILLGGKERWSRAAIDEALVSLAGGAYDWRKDQPGLNPAADKSVWSDDDV
jgi:predicted DNA-binding transcriptional regulator AlpA